MAFTQPCFIQLQHSVDVWFVIDKLNMLGYKPCIHQYGLQEGSESTYIICKSDGLYYFAYSISYYTDDWGINCIDNKELFIALAALRDDTNENQWFIAQDTMWDEDYNGEINVYYEEGEWLIWGYYSLMETRPSDFRKATKEEIIKHFKK